MSSLRVRLILAGLWLGGLAAVGLIGAPTAFALLPEKMQAAALASRLFYLMTLAALVLGGLLVLLERWKAQSLASSRSLFLVFGGLFFAVLGEFGIVPNLISAAVSHAATAGLWHTAASLAYLLQAACVFAYIWTLPLAGTQTQG